MGANQKEAVAALHRERMLAAAEELLLHRFSHIDWRCLF